MTRTPMEKLDREISVYTALIHDRRWRGADTTDHESHLQLLYVQRAAMMGRAAAASMDALDDAAALLSAEPPPVAELARPPRWLRGFPQDPDPLTADELEPIRNAVLRVARHRRGGDGWFRRLGRVLRDAWRTSTAEHAAHTYERGGLGVFL